MSRQRKGIFPLLRKDAPIIKTLRERKGGGIETGIGGRVRMLPNFIIEKRSSSPSPSSPRTKKRSKPKYVTEPSDAPSISSKPKAKKTARKTAKKPHSKRSVTTKKPHTKPESPKKQRPKIKAKKIKAKVVKPVSKKRSASKKQRTTRGSPPKLVKQYAQSMAKSVGVSYQTALNSEPVQNYWKKQLE